MALVLGWTTGVFLPYLVFSAFIVLEEAFGVRIPVYLGDRVAVLGYACTGLALATVACLLADFALADKVAVVLVSPFVMLLAFVPYFLLLIRLFGIRAT